MRKRFLFLPVCTAFGFLATVVGSCGDGTINGPIDCLPDCGVRVCGPVPNDCGESCGTCADPKSCDISSGQCEACTPDCSVRECGPDPQNCGFSCGRCSLPGQFCNLTTGLCEDCSPDCGVRVCGPVPNGCGESCGTCEDPLSCDISSGQCEGCSPDCGVRVCGPVPNGCGASCGSCSDSQSCNVLSGQCEDLPTNAFYVATTGDDLNPGSFSSPWRTIQHAADTASAGDTVFVMGGTYKEKITISKSGNSTAGYIAFSGFTGETATIDGTGISLGSWDALIRIYGASYVRISSFHVIHSSFMGIMVTSNYSGAYPSNIIIQNNHVSDTSSSAIFTEDGNFIIYDGNEISQAQTMKGLGGQSNEIMNLARTNNFEIKNNYLHDNANFESITVKDGSSSGSIFHNEVIGGPTHNSFSAGIYVDAQGKPSQNIDIFQNIVHDAPTSGARGIAVGSENVAGTGSMKNVRVVNNIVWNVGAIGIVAGPSHSVGEVDNIKVVNNTVFHNGLVDGGWGGGIIAEYTSAKNVLIENNVVSQNQGRGQICTDNGGNSVVRNNLFDGASQVLGSEPVVGNPQFVNPGVDFHLQSTSPAIDKGTETDAPATDYDGDSRPKGSGYDIGAYEFQP